MSTWNPRLRRVRRPRHQRLERAASIAVDYLERRLLFSGQVFVVDRGSDQITGGIAEYSTTGATINASFATGLNTPNAIAVSGSDVFVSNINSTTDQGQISEYTTSGTLVNPSLITGVLGTTAIAVSGNDIFVVHGDFVGEFTTSGTTVNTDLIHGLVTPDGIVVSGSDIFIANYNVNAVLNTGSIGEYTTTGEVVNASLVSGLNGPQGIALSGSDLFVSYGDTIGEFSTAGATVNPTLATGAGLNDPMNLALSGSDLFVVNYTNSETGSNGVGEFATTGGTVSSLLIPVSLPYGIAATSTNQLVFATAPTGATSTGTLAPITVDVEDPNGNLLTSDNSDVTLAIATGPNGATLGGTTIVAATNGVATFSDMSLAQAGTYSLSASDGAYASATTAAFSVTAPTSIVPTFGNVKLPPAVVAGGKLSAKVPVIVTNNGSDFTGSVTVNLDANTGTTLDGSPMQIASITKKKVSLKTGKSLTLNFSIKSLPSSLPNSTYHLVADVAAPAGPDQFAATTQTVQVAAAFIQPELTVSPVTPATFAIGKTATDTVTITNNGNESARGLTLSLSPSANDATPLPGMVVDTVHSGAAIQPGKSKTFKLHFKLTSAAEAGTYFPFVAATLDGESITAVGSESFTVG